MPAISPVAFINGAGYVMDGKYMASLLWEALHNNHTFSSTLESIQTAYLSTINGLAFITGLQLYN